MNHFVIFLFISLIFLCASYFFIKSFETQRRIRQAIKQAFIVNKSFINNDVNMGNQKFDQYQRVYNTTLFNLKRSYKKINTMEPLVSKELRRIVKSPISKLMNSIFYYSKIVFSFIFLALSIYFGSIIIEEYKKNPIQFSNYFEQLNNLSKNQLTTTSNQTNPEKFKFENKDSEHFNNGVVAYEKGEYEEAKKQFKSVPKGSSYYESAQNYLKDIEETLYYSNILFPSYAEITKSPDDYKGKTVCFTGTVYDISEFKGKTLMIISYEELDVSSMNIGELMILYPEKTDFMEGDIINVIGEMKGRYLDAKDFVDDYLKTPYTYSYTYNTNPNQMPVIVASEVGEI